MPYTIHLAETEAEARDTLADLAIDYQVHQKIFDPARVEFHDLPLFYHLSDFYQDSVSDGGPFVPVGPVSVDPRAISLKAQLDDLKLLVEGRANRLATPDEALRVQILVEDMLAQPS